MRQRGFRTKREAVDRALRALDVEPLSREEMLELEGIGWKGDLDGLRSVNPTVQSWLDRGST